MDGPVSIASFNIIFGITADPKDNLFVAGLNNVVRKIDMSTQMVSTFVGFGPSSGNVPDGLGFIHKFNEIHHVMFDVDGNLIVTDMINQKIKRVLEYKMQ